MRSCLTVQSSLTPRGTIHHCPLLPNSSLSLPCSQLLSSCPPVTVRYWSELGIENSVNNDQILIIASLFPEVFYLFWTQSLNIWRLVLNFAFKFSVMHSKPNKYLSQTSKFLFLQKLCYETIGQLSKDKRLFKALHVCVFSRILSFQQNWELSSIVIDIKKKVVL